VTEPGQTDEAKAAAEEGRKKLAERIEQYGELSRDPADETPEAKKEREAKTQKLVEEIIELQQKLAPKYEYHGWVWLFLRKPAQ
jgi:hypothetical protein